MVKNKVLGQQGYTVEGKSMSLARDKKNRQISGDENKLEQYDNGDLSVGQCALFLAKKDSKHNYTT